MLADDSSPFSGLSFSYVCMPIHVWASREARKGSPAAGVAGGCGLPGVGCWEPITDPLEPLQPANHSSSIWLEELRASVNTSSQFLLQLQGLNAEICLYPAEKRSLSMALPRLPELWLSLQHGPLSYCVHLWTVSLAGPKLHDVQAPANSSIYVSYTYMHVACVCWLSKQAMSKHTEPVKLRIKWNSSLLLGPCTDW